MYLNATEAPHGYLLLDISRDTDDNLWFRTCIFKDKAQPVIYADISDETHKGELPDSSWTKELQAKIAYMHYIELRQ